MHENFAILTSAFCLCGAPKHYWGLNQFSVDCIEKSMLWNIKDNGLGEGIEEGYKWVKFDIAVTSQDENKTGLGGKISVVNLFSIKGDSENTSALTNFSRIQFETLIAVKTT